MSEMPAALTPQRHMSLELDSLFYKYIRLDKIDML